MPIELMRFESWMEMANWYELTLEHDDNDTWFVTCPEFPEVTTFGETGEEAHRNGLKAIEEAIAARISLGEDLPMPFNDDENSARRRKYAVEVPMLVFLKMALYMVCKEKEVTRAELARRLGWKRNSVDRLFVLDHNSRLEQIEKAFSALGVKLSSPVPSFGRAA